MNKPAEVAVLWKRCNNQADVPRQKHWAIIETGSISEHDPYNESSPNRVDHLVYIAYFSREEWEIEIVKRTKQAMTPGQQSEPFIAVEVSPVTIETTVAVKVC